VTSDPPMLDVSVAKSYGAITIDATFQAGQGITTLFGKSGSGKTSVINMIAGLVEPDRGHVSVNGIALYDSEARVDVPVAYRRLGYVFQDSLLFPHMTVLKNLTYGSRNGAGSITLDHVTALLGIDHLLDRRPGTLSGGEKQRVAIGRAFLASPRLVLMDEPLASLDTDRREEILPFIESLRDDLGLPILYVSHNIDEIIRLADTLVLMNDGKVAAAGPVESLMSRFDLAPLTGPDTAGTVLPAVVERHDDTFDLTELKVPGGTLIVPRLKAALGARLRARIRARDVSLALEKPQDISVLNGFSGVILEMSAAAGPQVDVLIDTGYGSGDETARLWARITRRSAHDLALMPGKEVHALVKSVSFDRESLGHVTGATSRSFEPG
jgi:molybdate transport system ATP-binding protein